MSNMKNVFGEMTAEDILTRINHIVNMTGYISEACEALKTMGDGDSSDWSAEANSIATVVQCRETTNQQILRLYEKMYDDLLRLSGLAETNE